MRKIDIEESQSLLLAIAKIVNGIASTHNIPFFMVAGTMLGAIRHKGFIPWDDDMDFGVTYDKYWKFVDVLKKELPTRYKCITFEDDDILRSFFFKVVDTTTYIDDPGYNLPLDQKMGLAIDVFPIVSCNEKDGRKKAKLVYRQRATIRRVFANSRNGNLSKRIAKSILKLLLSQKHPKDFNRKIKRIVDSIQPGEKYCNIASPHYWKIIFDKEIFEDLKNYPFCDTQFLGPKDYDKYLSRYYMNYMQLPPEEKRRKHASNYYMKDSL